MQPGMMRKRAQIQRPVIARAASGEQTITWQNAATRWVAMRYLSGMENQQGALEVQASQKWIVSARWETAIRDIDATWQLVIDGQVYRIEAVDNAMGANRDLRIFCKVDD